MNNVVAMVLPDAKTAVVGASLVCSSFGSQISGQNQPKSTGWPIGRPKSTGFRRVPAAHRTFPSNDCHSTASRRITGVLRARGVAHGGTETAKSAKNYRLGGKIGRPAGRTEQLAAVFDVHKGSFGGQLRPSTALWRTTTDVAQAGVGRKAAKQPNVQLGKRPIDRSIRSLEGSWFLPPRRLTVLSFRFLQSSSRPSLFICSEETPCFERWFHWACTRPTRIRCSTPSGGLVGWSVTVTDAAEKPKGRPKRLCIGGKLCRVLRSSSSSSTIHLFR